MDIAQEIALPKVKGSTVDSLPENLYIPPKALLLLLDVFSGPMDFLLYLVPVSYTHLTLPTNREV